MRQHLPFIAFAVSILGSGLGLTAYQISLIFDARVLHAASLLIV